jgi:hypothetical protein
MNRLFGLVVLFVGILFVVYTFNAPESVSAQMSQIIPGAPTFKTLWRLLIGAGALSFGIVNSFNSTKHS